RLGHTRSRAGRYRGIPQDPENDRGQNPLGAAAAPGRRIENETRLEVLSAIRWAAEAGRVDRGRAVCSYRPVPRARARRVAGSIPFTVVFYGSTVSCCKPAQLSETPREPVCANAFGFENFPAAFFLPSAIPRRSDL